MSRYHQGYNKLIDELEKEGILYDYDYDYYEYYDYHYYNYRYNYYNYYVRPDITILAKCSKASVALTDNRMSNVEYMNILAFR